MRIVGLCKTLTCCDFLPAVLPNIMDFVDHIVFVHSYKSWNGDERSNECIIPVIDFFAEHHSCKTKATHLYDNSGSQAEQYNLGYKHIVDNLEPDWIFVFDTDEYWEKSELDKLRAFAGVSHCNALRCSMKTYIKTPAMLIYPPEPCKPTVMVRPVFPKLKGTRGNGVSPSELAPVFFHHYSYVRASWYAISEKIVNSTAGDCDDVPGMRCHDIQQWKKDKWDALPNATDFHTSIGYESAWKSVKEISDEEIPEQIRNLPITKQLLKDGSRHE